MLQVTSTSSRLDEVDAPACLLCGGHPVDVFQRRVSTGPVGDPLYGCGERRSAPVLNSFGGGWVEISSMPPAPSTFVDHGVTAGGYVMLDGSDAPVQVVSVAGERVEVRYRRDSAYTSVIERATITGPATEQAWHAACEAREAAEKARAETILNDLARGQAVYDAGERPGECEQQAILRRLAAVNGRLPRSVKSIATTAERLNAVCGSQVEIEADDDGGIAHVRTYAADCRCGEPATKAGACSRHRYAGRHTDQAHIPLSWTDTGHDLGRKSVEPILHLLARTQDEAVCEQLRTLADLTQALADPRARQRDVDAVRRAAAAQAAPDAPAARAPRRMPRWREHITSTTAALNAAAAAHGVQIEARPDNPEEVYVAVPVPATRRGLPQYDRDGAPRMRHTGLVTVRVDPTDRVQMGGLDAHVRAAVADQLEALRRRDPHYTDQANADNAAAADTYAAWLAVA